MSRRVLLPTVLLAGWLCTSASAAPLLFGTFDIAGNITVSNPGFNGCPATALCISWSDPPATAANKVDIAGSGLTGVFAALPGFSGNDAANISNLVNPPEIVDGPGFPAQPFMSFNAPGVTTTLLVNFIFAGIYPPTCGGAPAVGQQCTVPGSLFNLVNNPGITGPQATATAVLSGVTNDGLSIWQANLTAQFNVPFQTLLTQQQTNGSITNSFSGTITVIPSPTVPEAGTLSLLGLGLVGFSIKLRRRRS